MHHLLVPFFRNRNSTYIAKRDPKLRVLEKLLNCLYPQQLWCRSSSRTAVLGYFEFETIRRTDFLSFFLIYIGH